MKNRPFTIIILMVNILFFVSLIWWVKSTLDNFSLMNKPLENKPAIIEPLNKGGYYQIFPTPTAVTPETAAPTPITPSPTTP